MFHTYMSDISTKSLQKGSAEFLVLSILDGPDRHGYELAQIIESRSNGKLSFKAATPTAKPAERTDSPAKPIVRK